ncbi:MAG: acyl-[acyl-carrier-protein]--UDP-N-acetylglucosam ine O-acyltransferase [Nitrospirales bacterium]|nr:MAG: acyl-[acyl-carrier-protein]--UDP-N-acetylglucosam ine O-acyltransferase [Nitrospirales bacterium]
MNIHPTAIVHPKAEIDDNVSIGPYCIVGEHVRIRQGTELVAHVNVEGHTEIGQRCKLFPYSSIGSPPQHLQYKDEPTKVVIGDDNILREYVTVNRATSFGGGVTRIGHHNFLMAYVHVAHDCELGDYIVMANAATLAGHIYIGNYSVIGGLVGVHQYVRIGEYAMVGGCSALGRDVPPFLRAAGGYRARLFGLNSIALRRYKFSSERIANLKGAFDVLFRQKHSISEATKLVRTQYEHSADVLKLVTFIESSRRGTCRGASRELDEEEV